MKKAFRILVLCLGFGAQPAVAATATCTAISPAAYKASDKQITAVWFVPARQARAYFLHDDGGRAPAYVVPGDMLLSDHENARNICATYVRKGHAVAAGWLAKNQLQQFTLVDFGSFDVWEEKDQPKLNQAYNALAALAHALPATATWRGRWQDFAGNSVNIWKKGAQWQLNTMGIAGAVGTGNAVEDSVPLQVHGALAISTDQDNAGGAGATGVCDIVIVGFNNALLATSGAHCMGSGYQQAWPQFSGIYWKK